ncbi:helix-turn-helix domain-containing protein [Vibrio cholerae]|uniref:helix-turn-helix transcriptional regulator n=1 Tax=Vibrio cholerae TaxID=666 RepID=UPI0016522D30|nr:helix-turn-helix transcriptional regulator [Vibrio cholerae]EHS1090053.1 helix-turn-helix domain-containing protein [Vibrio cholerae]EKE8762569.1 helix-turn-helix domain-containing protein [Vibrio cholerae]EKF9296587.1 helix-turn-helix domain-containing protein [Vibrio cholerae]EKF9657258.1 helix-turn-helix domain-containing protein [Vibrio cholerae]EKF9676081.1 helix-turn-helix domain-containing protein [Vibrio cholerae]
MKPSNKESVQDTVARLRANRNQQQPKVGKNATHSIKEQTLDTPTRSKASKNAKAVSAAERKTEANKIIKHLLLGELTQGQALKSLRINILGLKQDVFARLVDVSRKTLSDIENDRGSYNTEILNKVFKPFSLKIGLLPSSPYALKSLLMDGEDG